MSNINELEKTKIILYKIPFIRWTVIVIISLTAIFALLNYCFDFFEKIGSKNNSEIAEVPGDEKALISDTILNKNVILKDDQFTDDRDGKIYKTIQIGNQIWMAENLNFEESNGSWIYANDPSNAEIYGRLYNWETACNVCPKGWHLPSESEWMTLIDFLGGKSIAGSKMKMTGNEQWFSPNDATNESGFSALPGGYRLVDGNYKFKGANSRFLSSTELYNPDTGYIKYLDISYTSTVAILLSGKKNEGFSVRCIKD